MRTSSLAQIRGCAPRAALGGRFDPRSSVGRSRAWNARSRSHRVVALHQSACAELPTRHLDGFTPSVVSNERRSDDAHPEAGGRVARSGSAGSRAMAATASATAASTRPRSASIASTTWSRLERRYHGFRVRREGGRGTIALPVVFEGSGRGRRDSKDPNRVDQALYPMLALYPDSPVPDGPAGHLRGRQGDRLPRRSSMSSGDRGLDLGR
jgi:hypothetical protein